MAEAGKPRIKLPGRVARGEVFEIKTLIAHVMESGRRKDGQGNTIPRRIINRFICRAAGKEVFAVDLHPSIAANPYLSFFLRLEEPTELEFTWIDDNGQTYTAKEKVDIQA